MEEQKSTNNAKITLVGNPLIDTILLVIIVMLIFVVAFTDYIAKSYVIKILSASICVGLFSFIVSFLSRRTSEGIQTRRVSYFLASLPIFVTTSNSISGIYDLPANQRHAAMLSQKFLLPLLLFVTINIIAHILGIVVSRRKHLDTELIPLDEEEIEDEENMQEFRQKFLKLSLLVFICMLPAFISIFLFPKHSHYVIAATSLILMCGASFFVGFRWSQQDSMNKRMWIFIAFIGPVAGFIGNYYGSTIQDSIHLIRALIFTGIVAFIIFISAIIGRIIAKRNN